MASFFLSYARGDNERDVLEEASLVRSFFERLRTEIGNITSEEPDADGSFIDEEIPLGAQWEDHIHRLCANATCSCRS
jgi:hypothetical protein